MLFKKPFRSVQRVFLHCSASDNAAHDDISVMNKWHKERGFAEVGYHYFIKKDGTLQAGRNIEKTPAAQQGNNLATIAICLHGLNRNRFTAEQFRTLRAIVSAINKAYNGQVSFHGHREVARKDCPVFDYKALLELDAKGKTKLGLGETK